MAAWTVRRGHAAVGGAELCGEGGEHLIAVLGAGLRLPALLGVALGDQAVDDPLPELLLAVDPHEVVAPPGQPAGPHRVAHLDHPYGEGRLRGGRSGLT